MDYGIGFGCEPGRLWMKSTDGNWYELTLSGSSGSAAISVNQTPLTLQDNSLGYQLLQANDNKVYQVTISGSSGSVAIAISQTAWANSFDYKPNLFMKSLTDQCFYVVSAVNTSGTISLVVNQSTKIFIPNW